MLYLRHTGNESIHRVVFCCDARLQLSCEMEEREKSHLDSLSRLTNVQRSHMTQMTESFKLLTQRPDVVVTGTDMSRHYISGSTQRFEVRRSIESMKTQLMQESHGRLQQLQQFSLDSLYQRLENGDQQQVIRSLEGFMKKLQSLDSELTAAEQRRVMLEQTVMHSITTENEEMMTMMSLLNNYGRPAGPTVIACC